MATGTLQKAQGDLKKLISAINTILAQTVDMKTGEEMTDAKRHSKITFVMRDKFGKNTTMEEVVAASQSADMLLKLAKRKDDEVKSEREGRLNFAANATQAGGLLDFMSKMGDYANLKPVTSQSESLEEGETTE